ncbi:MAG: lysylphosphatidylglycerol synthase domain-containing protein [Burkholderiaceae bacterium]
MKRWPRAWPRIKRTLGIAFAVAVLALIGWHAREIDWSEVLTALRALPLSTIALGAAIAVAAHAAYISYDLLARRYTGHRLGIGKTSAVAGVCFAFNLNLGALVGGVALRYRLYGRFGLATSVITRILGFSVLTNWIGYSALAGAAFASGLVDLPDSAPISTAALRVFGAVLLLVAAAYLAACRWSPKRRWNVRGHTIELPRARMAVLQITASVTHWSLVASVLYVLLQGKVGFVTVLGALLLSSVAGVITHIPAGLGVLEAVFLSLLSGAHPINQLLAALLAYRAVFYLGPLIVAGLAYVALELSARRHPRSYARSGPQRPSATS